MPTVYITVPSDDADVLAETLVAERVAACVNQVACESTYRWDGEIVQESEVVLLAKTSDARYEDLVDVVLEEHPHDVPCIERIDEADVLEGYADWRDSVVE